MEVGEPTPMILFQVVLVGMAAQVHLELQSWLYLDFFLIQTVLTQVTHISQESNDSHASTTTWTTADRCPLF
jgi:hypothetical protein